MDTISANLFKAVEAKRLSRNRFNRPNSRPQINSKSKFQIMKEKLEALEWKPELPLDGQAFIPKGWRNATLRWFGFTLKNLGVERGIIEQTINKAAKEICVPPISDNNTEYIIQGIFK